MTYVKPYTRTSGVLPLLGARHKPVQVDLEVAGAARAQATHDVRGERAEALNGGPARSQRAYGRQRFRCVDDQIGPCAPAR